MLFGPCSVVVSDPRRVTSPLPESRPLETSDAPSTCLTIIRLIRIRCGDSGPISEIGLDGKTVTDSFL